MLHQFHGHVLVERPDTGQQLQDALDIFATDLPAAERAAELGYRQQGLRILDGQIAHLADRCRACNRMAA